MLAIGNPFGVGQTVTSGIISALARTRVGISDYQFFIQTDAAINPGNSGGALVDMNGTLSASTPRSSPAAAARRGIGFAIPANMVRVVVNSALRGGKVERPWLGAELQAVTPEIAESLGLDRPRGALITQLADNSPAQQAGLRLGDVITAIDGREVSDPQAALYRIATKGVRNKAALDVISKGQKRQLQVALISPPETVPRDVRELDGVHPFSGTTVANLSPAVAEELAMTEISGVVVLETKAYSTARRLGLQAGDIIAKINDEEVRTVSHLRDLLSRKVRAWDLPYGAATRNIAPSFVADPAKPQMTECSRTASCLGACQTVASRRHPLLNASFSAANRRRRARRGDLPASHIMPSPLLLCGEGGRLLTIMRDAALGQAFGACAHWRRAHWPLRRPAKSALLAE